MIHHFVGKFGNCCEVSASEATLEIRCRLAVEGCDEYESYSAWIESPQDARALAKFLIEWAEKVEGKGNE